MAYDPAGNEKKCPKCGFRQIPGEICINCGLVFAKYRPPVSTWAVSSPQETTGQPDAAGSGAVTATAEYSGDGLAGKVDILNIIVVLFLLDSSLSLLHRVPALAGVFAGPMTFHQKAKSLYDVVTQAAMFISVIGVMMRKDWARIAMIALLALGLAEGVYMLIYLHVTVTGLEKEMHENLSDIQRNNSMKWIGCALYAWFIAVLNSAKVKARFHR